MSRDSDLPDTNDIQGFVTISATQQWWSRGGDDDGVEGLLENFGDEGFQTG